MGLIKNLISKNEKQKVYKLKKLYVGRFKTIKEKIPNGFGLAGDFLLETTGDDRLYIMVRDGVNTFKSVTTGKVGKVLGTRFMCDYETGDYVVDDFDFTPLKDLPSVCGFLTLDDEPKNVAFTLKQIKEIEDNVNNALQEEAMTDEV